MLKEKNVCNKYFFFTFHNIFFYAQLAFVFQFLRDSYIIHGHIVVFVTGLFDDNWLMCLYTLNNIMNCLVTKAHLREFTNDLYQ